MDQRNDDRKYGWQDMYGSGKGGCAGWGGWYSEYSIWKGGKGGNIVLKGGKFKQGAMKGEKK